MLVVEFHLFQADIGDTFLLHHIGEPLLGTSYEFAFVITPLKLEGATGSTVAPIAIR